MMEKIHSFHLGIERCLRRAKEVLYWPRMNAELKDVILNCDVCNSYKPEKPKERLMPHEFPTKLWQKVETDLMQFDGRQYLITVNYYSLFFEVDQLQSTDSRLLLRNWNGPQYDSCELSKVCFGFFSILSLLPATNKAKERWRVLLKSAKASWRRQLGKSLILICPS